MGQDNGTQSGLKVAGNYQGKLIIVCATSDFYSPSNQWFSRKI
jgi:hypothetical protein